MDSFNIFSYDYMSTNYIDNYFKGLIVELIIQQKK